MVNIQPDGDDTIFTAGLIALSGAWRFPVSVAMDAREKDNSLSPRFARISCADGKGWVAVLLSEHDVRGAALAIDGGASGLVSLTSPVSELYAAIQAIDTGQGPFINGGIAHRLAHKVRGRDDVETERGPSHPNLTGRERDDAETERAGSYPALTGREREVLGLLALGYTNREIAAEFVVSVNTVRTHVHSLAVKLGGSSRARILANARSAGIPEAWALDDTHPA